MLRSRLVSWVISLCLLLAGLAAACLFYRVSPPELTVLAARKIASPVFARLHEEDQAWVGNKVSSYWHGLPDGEPRPGSLPEVPFVYENFDAPFLQALRERFQLEQMTRDTTSEYEAVLRLGGWVGQQFDHGLDPVVGGDKACDPIHLIEDGQAGKKYWCEIAARVMVHVAASVGLPARIITASRDGYTWEHAVAEVWSNDFNKWFVVDTDFNMVYEHEGRPLSAVELLQFGQKWSNDGTMTIRHIAPPKPSIPKGDAIYVYRYVHVDMRNDWCTRSLRRGSPAGGDLATWWYSEAPFAGRLLTSKVRLSSPDGMDWRLNNIVTLPPAGDAKRHLAVATFSPYFSHFETKVDGQWVSGGKNLEIPADQSLEVRVVTAFGWRGPAYRVADGRAVLAQ